MEPTQPLEPPDWVPPWWTRGRFNRWFGRSPGRMVVWWFVAPIVVAAAAVGAALSGSGWLWALAPATVFITAQSVIYGPRAWRAYRR
jgi:hypothetical protein